MASKGEVRATIERVVEELRAAVEPGLNVLRSQTAQLLKLGSDAVLQGFALAIVVHQNETRESNYHDECSGQQDFSAETQTFNHMRVSITRDDSDESAMPRGALRFARGAAGKRRHGLKDVSAANAGSLGLATNEDSEWLFEGLSG